MNPKEKKAPIQLISFGTDKKLQVNEEAIKWLNKVNQDKHIGVITVVGKYRTGKSYILNRVLLNQNSGFEVGPTINACTKGLWVWPQLIQSPDDPTVQFLVMDTQGLGSLEQGQQADTKIFLMAMLLSSYFIYNSVGSIDEKAVQNLSLIINLSKLLQKGGKNQMQQILNCFPTFLWLVRDFALRLVDQNNNQITPKQYLENALKLQNGNSDMIIRKNSVRKQLINFFRERDCFMLIRPVDDQRKLQNMSKVKDSQLRPQFLALVNELQTKIFKGGKKKTFQGKPCTPTMFIQLCQHFCQSINKGGLPQIESNWELVCKAESARVEKKCIAQFVDFLRKYQSLEAKDIDLKKFERKTQDFMFNLLKIYEKNAIGIKDQKKRIFKEKLETILNETKSKLTQQKNHEIQSIFADLTTKIDDMISTNSFKNIFEITDQYDQIIEKQLPTATNQNLNFLYKKCYDGLKSTSYSYFGTIMQNQKFENNLLSQKLDLYQDSLNRIQSQQTKKSDQAEGRQRQLRKNVNQLELKVREAIAQLQKAKRELEGLRKNEQQNTQFVR